MSLSDLFSGSCDYSVESTFDFLLISILRIKNTPKKKTGLAQGDAIFIRRRIRRGKTTKRD
jgi:hypothetical protein